MYERIHAGPPDDLHQERIADVRSDILGPFEVQLRLFQVDPDDVLDAGVGLQPSGQPGREVARDARDEDALAHVRKAYRAGCERS